MQIARRHAAEAASEQRDGTFVGTVFVDPVLPSADGNSVNDVFFTPGARTYWHSHEFGQVLKVTSGTGLICSHGERPSVIRAGDVVWVPANERHWHGGTATTVLTHTAVSLGRTTWLDPVDDADYGATPFLDR